MDDLKARPKPTASPSVDNSLRVVLPEPSVTYEQDAEHCLVEVSGQWQEIRFHDYAEIYAIEGLYEKLFYEILECSSPKVVRGLLQQELAEAEVSPGGLRVLDLGAGNGIMGEELVDLGVDRVVGVDIIPEAAAAAERDRAGVYDDYNVLDITNASPEQYRKLDAHEFNAMSCVAALGFGDIPPQAFSDAYNLVSDGGWVAFTIKDKFLSDQDPSGFSELVTRCTKEDILEVRSAHRYQHRMSTNGEALHYTALVGVKLADIPDDFQN